MLEPYLNNIALGVLLVLLTAGVYLVIYIHDIPYEIAKKRNHPHQDAFQAAGWVSLFLMHSIWPILWIWAFWYKKDAVPGTVIVKQEEDPQKEAEINSLHEEIKSLKAQLNEINENNNNK